MGWITGMMGFIQDWHTEKFLREFLSLEHDVLPRATVDKKEKVPKAVIAHGAEETTTGDRATHVDTKYCRAAVQNNIVVSVKFQESDAHMRVVSIMCYVPWALKVWQGKAVAKMKSVKENLEWIKEQMARCFLDHTDEVLNTLVDPKVMDACGFKPVPGDIEENDVHAFLVAEDDFAVLAGDLALSLRAFRQRRLMPMTSTWPNAATRGLCSADHLKDVRLRFMADHASYLYVVAVDNP